MISKAFLLFNTVRYLKPQQIVNQVAVRLKRSESFWKYEKTDVEYRKINLWIDGLDNYPMFMERFKVPDLVKNNQLTLLNETREFERWQFKDVSHLWNFNAHYLEYLVPLYSLWRPTGDEQYKKKLNQILEDWYEVGSRCSDSNQSYTISLRIINQLIIADAVDDIQRLMDSIYAQYRYLLNHQEKHLLGNHYLENLKAIVICSVLFSEDDVYEKYIKRLLEELDEQITPDGLHYELSVMYHKIVLEDLIRVAVVLRNDGKSELADVAKYIERMVTALYSLERGCSRTPLFNDAGDNVAKPTEALITSCEKLFDVKAEGRKDSKEGKGSEDSKNSIDNIAGYYILYDGNITVIFDCGELAPTYMPGHGHNDCLSFELFYNGCPVFVNSGTYQYQGDKRQYFKSTAAHNTVVVNGHEQSELWGEHRAGRRIRNIRSKADKDSKSIIGSYKNYLGENHVRRIRLKNCVFEVFDKTSGDGQSYLHLAPGLGYKDGWIQGSNLKIRVEAANCQITTQRTPYSEEFGKMVETECLVFSWNDDKKKHGHHGYRIKIEEQ